MRIIPLLLIGSALAACSTAPETYQRSERAEARLQQELAGLTVTGPAQNCIPNYRADQMVVIDDNTLLFRDGPSRVWRNDLAGSCGGLGLGNTLVLRLSTGMLCSGEIGQVVDLTSGVTSGSCVLGEFTPYGRS